MPSTISSHVCPYAAALSDDEDGGSTSTTTNTASPHAHGDASLLLSEARKKCPAFANNAPCPFRDVQSNPESLMEVMKKVPPSHFIRGRSGSGGSNSSSDANEQTGEGSTSSSAATHFQLAMEHVHHVSSTLMHQTTTSNESDSSSSGNNKNNNDYSNFILPGGCPFKAYHQRHYQTDNSSSSSSSSSSSTQQLHLSMIRAMEDFSLSAIMGRMATTENNHVVLGDRDIVLRNGRRKRIAHSLLVFYQSHSCLLLLRHW